MVLTALDGVPTSPESAEVYVWIFQALNSPEIGHWCRKSHEKVLHFV